MSLIIMKKSIILYYLKQTAYEKGSVIKVLWYC